MYENIISAAVVICIIIIMFFILNNYDFKQKTETKEIVVVRDNHNPMGWYTGFPYRHHRRHIGPYRPHFRRRMRPVFL